MNTHSNRSWSNRAAELARDLARSPEPSGREFRSSRMICSFLEDAGLRLTRGLRDLPTAFLAEAGDRRGPRVCLIVEFDALPGLGHACGHNINAAMASLAGAMLAPLVRSAGGCLLVAGTPDEERSGAKAIMIRQGAFRGTGLALFVHAGAWKSRLRYRTSAFRNLLIHGARSEPPAREVLEQLRQKLSSGETANLRKTPEGNSLRLDIISPTAEGRDRLAARASRLLRQQRLRFTPDGGEEPLEPFLPNQPVERRLAALWHEMNVPFEEAPIWLGTSDMGNLSRCCPTHQSILSVTDLPLAWHTTTFADAAKTVNLSSPIFAGALSLARLSLLFWQDELFRREVTRAFVAGKSHHIPS